MAILQAKEAELKDVTKIIAIEANKCHKLLKKPPVHDVDDLIQEGNIVFLRVYEKYNPESEYTFKQFFYRSLVNRFSDMLTKSYKDINSGEELLEPPIWNCPAQLCMVKECCENLSEAARDYLQACTNPPADLQLELVGTTRRHGLIRKHLGISLRKEQQIRAEIINSLKP